MGIAEGQADCVVRKLVDVRDRVATAMIGRAGVQRPDVVPLIARVHGDSLATIGQGPDSLKVNSATQTLTDQSRVRGLVDRYATEQFRRILIELHAPVVASRDLFTPVQQSRRKVGTEPSDGDGLAAPVQALRRQAGQTSKRFGDGHIRQLADVLGGNDLDDRGVAGLGRDRVLDGRANAGDNDLINLGRFIGIRLCWDVLSSSGSDDSQQSGSTDCGTGEQTGTTRGVGSHNSLSLRPSHF